MVLDPLLPPAPRPVGAVVRYLAGLGPAAVAMSGGVDSALVASLAHEALGDQVWAVTLAGPAVTQREVERAGAIARSIGIRHVRLRVDPLADPRYVANPSNRCFFCRSGETSALRAWGEPRGIGTYLDGVQVDDLDEVRPGIRAMDAAGFLHPLAWAGWNKAHVRKIAHRRGLENWDEPSDACLASRVTHGQPITGPLLRRVEAAEAAIRALGFRTVRVRVDGGSARVEVGRDEVPRFQDPSLAATARERVLVLGFAAVTLDPLGYHGGGVPNPGP